MPADRFEALLTAMRRPLDLLPDPLLLPHASDCDRLDFTSTFVPPGSKSLTNRLLPLAGLSGGVCRLDSPLLEADDAERMIAAMQSLGVRVEIAKDRSSLRVHGTSGRWQQPPEGVTLNLNNAGTATRFLTALACLGSPGAGPITVDGNERMRERPIGELTDMLVQLGVRVEELGARRCPPIRVWPVEDLHALGSELRIGATASSQFVSAMIMLASFVPHDVRFVFDAPPTSPSYIEMTIGLLGSLGVSVQGALPDNLIIGRWSGQMSRSGLPFAIEADVEPDASGATYGLGLAAAIKGATCRCDGLANSLQGDARFVDWLEAMGASVDRDLTGNTIAVTGTGTLRGITTDASNMPDAAMTLAALAVLADSPTTITGLRTLRVKETDRLAALRCELAKFGAIVSIVQDAGDEGLHIVPPTSVLTAPITIDTYNDHRMAMACAIPGMILGQTQINDPVCVAKTFPGYWAAIADLLDA